jgi:acetyl esterase/lipase
MEGERMWMASLAAIGLPLGLLALLGGCAAAVSEGPAVTFRNPTGAEATTWLPEAQPYRRIRYAGDSPVQYGDLRLPAGRAPAAGYPVAVIIHGGAWHADWTSDYTSGFAEALTGAGIASWNIEFRRIGNRGGGYPGTFTDVGLATDFLRTLAESHPLDLGRVVVVGHSSGGHLALWSPAAGTCPKAAPSAGPIRSRSRASYRSPGSMISKARWSSAIGRTCLISSGRGPVQASRRPRRGGSSRSACRRC